MTDRDEKPLDIIGALIRGLAWSFLAFQAVIVIGDLALRVLWP